MCIKKQMAIFQKTYDQKITLDDTHIITCTIETAQKVNGHTEYVLKLQRGYLKENCWRILKRYNDFVELHKCLQISKVFLPLPGKKIIGNMRPEFIAERLLALQEYINIVLMNPILASSLPTKKFVDPESYNQPFPDIAIQNASLCLRTESIYVLGPSLGPIGWRVRKHYFNVSIKSSNSKGTTSGQISGKHLVKTSSQSHGKHFSMQNNGTSHSNDSHSQSAQNSSQSSSSKDGGGHGGNSSSGSHSGALSPTSPELYLIWIEYGIDKYIEDREMYNIFKCVAAVQHPYIHPIEYIATNDCGVLLIRKFNNAGSIKDFICGSQAKMPFITKYGNPKNRAPLPLRDVAMYGRQILEALRFLHSKGMPFGHLHAGNVIIVDGIARLVDIENFILGVPSFYRPYFTQHSKIGSVESIDVYAFAHLIYEMTMGYPLQDSISRSIDCPDSLRSLLESILSKEACKVGLPTLDQLATHKFFIEYAPKFDELNAKIMNQHKPHFKLSTVAKEQIKIAAQKTEQRLRDEQKLVKNQKRLARVQEMMSSEEEKKKIKHKAKLEQKQSRLRQQNSLQLNNGSQTTSTGMISSGGNTANNNSTVSRSDSTQSVSISQEILSPPPTSFPNTPSPKFNLTSPPPQQKIPPSTPTAGGSQTTTPLPPPLPPSPPSPPHQQHIINIPELTMTNAERSALLNSICDFNKSALKKISSDI